MAKAAKKKLLRKSRRGPGKPLGTSNGYTKRARRQGDISKQIQIQFRPVNDDERSFIEEAARTEFPDVKKPIPRFLSEASLSRAEHVLGRIRPQAAPLTVASPTIGASA